MKNPQPRYGRRAWLATAGSLLLTAVAVRLTYPSARQAAARWINSTADDANPGPAALAVVAQFTGTLMGQRLSRAQVEILIGRIAYDVRRSGQLAAQYAELAAYADRKAREAAPGTAGFSGASPEVRDDVMSAVMIRSANSARQKLAALTSSDGRARWRIRNATSVHLRRLYRRSPVPWQIRGYRGAPGAPSNPRDYTRPLESTGADAA